MAISPQAQIGPYRIQSMIGRGGAVAALNHPHICAIYDVGRQDSVDYVVFEYIGGETLAAKLRKGSLPLERALDYAIQIADALAAAHDTGVLRPLRGAHDGAF
jgi:serine/threonine protein kinase